VGLINLVTTVFGRRQQGNDARSRVETYRRLARMIELQAPVLAENSRRVADYSVQIAELMGLPPDEVQSIRLAAELRDIGYLRLPPSIFDGYGKLSRSEVEHIRRHPTIGEQILNHVPSLRHLVPLVLHHHERWDGSGYPEQLEGEDIPLGARIIAVADVFNAVTSRRPYRNAYATADGIEHLTENAGKLYDPEVVEVFTSQWHQRQNEFEQTSENHVLELRRSVPESTMVSDPNTHGWTHSKMEAEQVRG